MSIFLKAVNDKDTTKLKTVTFTKKSIAEHCGDQLLISFCNKIKTKIDSIL